MRMRDADADEVVPHLLDEGGVGNEDLDAGLIRPGEGDPAIDHQPLLPAAGPEAVEPHVHPDFAKPAQRHEDEFVRRFIHSPCLFHICIAAIAACIFC